MRFYRYTVTGLQNMLTHSNGRKTPTAIVLFLSFHYYVYLSYSPQDTPPEHLLVSVVITYLSLISKPFPNPGDFTEKEWPLRVRKGVFGRGECVLRSVCSKPEPKKYENPDHRSIT